MFSIAPLTSLSVMTPPVDPDPIASFRDLVAGPPDTAREAPHIDARRMRTLVDRGVVEYASAKTDGDRAKGAGLIQTAALVGYARLARAQLSAIRSSTFGRSCEGCHPLCAGPRDGCGGNG